MPRQSKHKWQSLSIIYDSYILTKEKSRNWQWLSDHTGNVITHRLVPNHVIRQLSSLSHVWPATQVCCFDLTTFRCAHVTWPLHPQHISFIYDVITCNYLWRRTDSRFSIQFDHIFMCLFHSVHMYCTNKMCVNCVQIKCV